MKKWEFILMLRIWPVKSWAEDSGPLRIVKSLRRSTAMKGEILPIMAEPLSGKFVNLTLPDQRAYPSGNAGEPEIRAMLEP